MIYELYKSFRMATPLISPKFYAWHPDTGNPLAFGKVYAFESGTSNTPKTTWQDEAGTVPNTHPVILNAAGYASIYIDGSYKIALTDADDVPIWDSDPVSSGSSSGSSSSGEWVLPMSAIYVGPTSFKVAGNQVSVFTKGRALQITGSSTITTHVDSASYGSGFTTVTIFGSESLSSGVASVSVGLITTYPLALFSTQVAVAGGAVVGSRPAAIFKFTGVTGGTTAYLDGIDGLTGGPVINGSATALQAGDIAFVLSGEVVTTYEMDESGATPDGSSIVAPNSNPGLRRWRRKESYVDKTAILSIAYPVGAIVSLYVSTSPATLYGFGTWEAHGAGRVPVCISAADTDFDTVGETGGAKAVTLSAVQSGCPAHNHSTQSQSVDHTHHFNTSASGAHTHPIAATTATSDSDNGYVSWKEGAGKSTGEAGSHAHEGDTGGVSTNHTHAVTNNTAAGAEEAHTNMPPYIVEYRWRRTA